MRFRAFLLAGLTLLLSVAMRPAACADKPLVFGVFPNMTAKQIVETYQPLATALEKKLQRRVIVYSARDFRTFVERTRKGEYDILLTAPHLAWLGAPRSAQNVSFAAGAALSPPARHRIARKGRATASTISSFKRRYPPRCRSPLCRIQFP